MNLFINRKKLEKKQKFFSIKRYFNLIIGCLLVALAYNLFLVPNNIVSGGVGGLAIILNDIFSFNNSLVILICNLILLVLSCFLLGIPKTKSTVLGSLLLPLLIQLTSKISTIITIDTSNLLLISIFGGVLNGFGLGMIFKAGFTTGGTDILNQIVSKFGKISIGNSMLICDGIIVLASGFAFGITRIMYSLIILYITSMISDRVILGISDSKAFYIITNKDDEIQDYILKVLNHGATIFNAKGGLARTERPVIMCVLPTKDYYKLKAGIKEIDNEAFVVVTDAYEVFGGE